MCMCIRFTCTSIRRNKKLFHPIDPIIAFFVQDKRKFHSKESKIILFDVLTVNYKKYELGSIFIIYHKKKKFGYASVCVFPEQGFKTKENFH